MREGANLSIVSLKLLGTVNPWEGIYRLLYFVKCKNFGVLLCLYVNTWINLCFLGWQKRQPCINPPLFNIYWQALHLQNFLTTSRKLEYVLLHGYLASYLAPQIAIIF